MKIRLAVLFLELVDRERKHPGEEASRHQGALGKEASRIRDAWAPGRRAARVFLGRLALGPGPIEAIGLGPLARGTKPGPMVPTLGICFVLPFLSSS